MKPTNKEILLQLNQARPDQSRLGFWVEEIATLAVFIGFVAATAIVLLLIQGT